MLLSRADFSLFSLLIVQMDLVLEFYTMTVHYFNLLEKKFESSKKKMAMLMWLTSILKMRNSKVFWDDDESVSFVIQKAAKDALLWSNRCKKNKITIRKQLFFDWGMMLPRLDLGL